MILLNCNTSNCHRLLRRKAADNHHLNNHIHHLNRGNHSALLLIDTWITIGSFFCITFLVHKHDHHDNIKYSVTNILQLLANIKHRTIIITPSQPQRHSLHTPFACLYVYAYIYLCQYKNVSFQNSKGEHYFQTETMADFSTKKSLRLHKF